jgi:nicotinate-nucleotide--dimethylbenzimidazole phosphoribosyltransferase
MSQINKSRSDIDEIRNLIQSFTPLNPSLWPDLWEQKPTNFFAHPRLSLFAGHHGFATSSPDSANDYVKKSVEGSSPINQLCSNANMDLRIYEMDMEGATQNCLEYGFALSTDEFAKTLAYGMMAVEPSLDLIATSALGNGTQNAAEAICAIHGLKTKISDELLNKKLKDTVRAARGVDCLPLIGGYELSALCGLIIAARLAEIPVLLEGVIGLSAIAILTHENKHACDHVALTGHINPNSLTENDIDIAYLPMPIQIPLETGICMAYLIPNLRSQIIIQESLATDGGHDHGHACGSGCGHQH